MRAALHEFRIPRRGLTERNRKHRLETVNDIAADEQGNAESAFLRGESLQFIHRLDVHFVQHRAHASRANRIAQMIGHVPASGGQHLQLAHLLLERHSPEQFTHALGDAGFDVDTNGDGVDNGLAFLLGASGPNVSALDKLPVSTQSAGALVLTFQMLDDTANGNATLAIEYGNSLAGGSWTAVPVPYTSGTMGDIVFNVTGTGPRNVTATIPASKAAGGKLFGRVKGVTP